MKVCRICKQEKVLADFHNNKTCSQGVTGTCRKCSAVRVRGWYSANRKRRQELQNNLNQKRKQEMVDAFGGICLDCKLSFPICVFEFHHLDPKGKDANPSKALSWSKERRDRELSKCVMLCSNCHKIRHFVRPDQTGGSEVKNDAG